MQNSCKAARCETTLHLMVSSLRRFSSWTRCSSASLRVYSNRYSRRFLMAFMNSGFNKLSNDSRSKQSCRSCESMSDVSTIKPIALCCTWATKALLVSFWAAISSAIKNSPYCSVIVSLYELNTAAKSSWSSCWASLTSTNGSTKIQLLKNTRALKWIPLTFFKTSQSLQSTSSNYSAIGSKQ